MKNQYITAVFIVALMGEACGNTPQEEFVEERSSITDAVEEVIVVEEIVEEAVPTIVEEGPIIGNKIIEQPVPQDEMVVDMPEEVVFELPDEDHVVVMPDHKMWNDLLKANVSATGKVNYKGMKTKLITLKTYLEHLRRNGPEKRWTKNERLAYWINLYNASTVYLIASNYPTTSITKLAGGKPWDKKFVKSGDKVYTLNQIENEIVRPRFKEPRIHAALNCAAVSCPNLLNEAFLPKTLDEQLTMQTRAWVNDETKNKLTPSLLTVSKIFEWYKADFKAGGGVANFIAKYSNRKYRIDPKTKIKYLEYNWSLNE